MPSERTAIADKVQEYLGAAKWESAIGEMEKLFAIDRDPHIRVRIGDLRRKLDRKSEAVREYLLAADLYAQRGFVVKALAQCSLALRLDPPNRDARAKREMFLLVSPAENRMRGPVEYRKPEELGSALLLSAAGG